MIRRETHFDKKNSRKQKKRKCQSFPGASIWSSASEELSFIIHSLLLLLPLLHSFICLLFFFSSVIQIRRRFFMLWRVKQKGNEEKGTTGDHLLLFYLSRLILSKNNTSCRNGRWETRRERKEMQKIDLKMFKFMYQGYDLLLLPLLVCIYQKRLERKREGTPEETLNFYPNLLLLASLPPSLLSSASAKDEFWCCWDIVLQNVFCFPFLFPSSQVFMSFLISISCFLF